MPNLRWFPDGHITVLRDRGGLEMYWAGASTYRTVGATVEAMRLQPEGPVLSRGATTTAFDNGGAWLMSVFPAAAGNCIGFYHAEDHEWKLGRSATGIAWKSIALCVSHDGGVSWEKKGRILTSAARKPEEPKWGGCGDHCVVRDPASRRWFCFFQEHFICMAASDDPQASPGTWKKWFEGGFAEPGLGGRVSPIAALKTHPGGNPSVHYNTRLGCWFMVWHTWSGNLVYSSSRDLVQWEHPAELLKCAPNEKAWYPTIVGESDTLAGESAELYYAFWPDKARWERQFLRRSIRFATGRGPGGTGSQKTQCLEPSPAAGSNCEP